MKEIILQKEQMTKINEPIVLGMGFFDCVHAGHRQLIKRMFDKATDCKKAIITFSNNPYKIFNTESKLIYTYDERQALFEQIGLDYCVPFKFDKFFKEMPYNEFLDLIFNGLNIKGIVCGYDYLFGYKGRGNIEILREYCDANNAFLEVIEPVVIDDERVSSTLVKKLLEQGNIEKINTLLTTPYFMFGTITHGRGEGKKIGCPTANLSIPKDKMLPMLGVYATYTYINGKKHKSVTNVGAKPTFDEHEISVETLIENIDCDLYGKEIKIEFCSYLRRIQKYDSPELLVAQIKNDLSKKY